MIALGSNPGQRRVRGSRLAGLPALRLLEEENRMLKQLAADLSIDNAMLQETVTKVLCHLVKVVSRQPNS